MTHLSGNVRATWPKVVPPAISAVTVVVLVGFRFIIAFVVVTLIIVVSSFRRYKSSVARK